MAEESRASELDFRHHLRALRRRWGVIACAVAVVVATTVAVSLVQTPVYQASADVLVPPTSASTSVFNQSNVVQVNPTQQLQTQIQIINSGPVSDLVQRQLGAARAVSVGQVNQTNVIAIRVVNDPQAGS